MAIKKKAKKSVAKKAAAPKIPTPDLSNQEVKVLIDQYNDVLELEPGTPGFIARLRDDAPDVKAQKLARALKKTLAEDEDNSFKDSAPNELLVFAEQCGLIELDEEEEESDDEEEADEEESDDEEEADEEEDDGEEEEESEDDEDDEGDEGDDDDESEEESDGEEVVPIIGLVIKEPITVRSLTSLMVDIFKGLEHPDSPIITITRGGEQPGTVSKAKPRGKFPFTKAELREKLKKVLKSDKARRKFIAEYGLASEKEAADKAGRGLAHVILSAGHGE